MISKREILKMIRKTNESIDCLLDISRMARERLNKVELEQAKLNARIARLEERVKRLEKFPSSHS